MTKPGYLTTEFWATVLLNVGSVATALAGALPPKWAAICSTVSVAVYALARSLTKTGATVPAGVAVVQSPAAAVAQPPATTAAG